MNIVPIKLVRNKLGYGQKKIYVPSLAPIMEERSNAADESEPESISASVSYSSEAHSEDWWSAYSSNETDEITHTDLKIEENYKIYSLLYNTVPILQRTESEEFKHYQAVFDKFLKDYSSYLNNTTSFLNEIKIIHSTQNHEPVNCCSIFKKKAPANTVTNKLIMLMIHSSMQLDLASIQRIQELVGDPSYPAQSLEF